MTSESVFTCRPESVFTCRPEYASNDSTVPVAQSETLDEALKAVGADAELHIVQGAGHGFGSPSSAWPDAEATIFEFLRERGIAE